MFECRFWHSILFISLQAILASCLTKSSLTFVIDDTSSMQPVIDQVKNASIGIMDIVLNVSSSQIEDLVVVTFNDPEYTQTYTKLWIKSRNRDEVFNTLNSIYAQDNTDTCPEYSMSGVYLGLNNSLPGSTIFVFTDSDPRDKHLTPSVIDLCQKTQSTVNFIITTSHCLTNVNTGLKVYYEVGKACSGMVLYINAAELSEVFSLMHRYIQGEMTEIDTYDLPSNHYRSRKQLRVDEEVEYVLITVSGTSQLVQVREGKQLVPAKRITWLRNVKALQLNNPKPGVYLVEIIGHGNVRVEIKGRTDFTFQHGFSEQLAKTIKDTTAQPIGDTDSYLSILVSDPSNAVLIKEVELFNMKDRSIIQMPLRKSNENFYKTEKFMSPSHTFKIAVNGIVKKSGRNISRFAKVPVKPQIIPKKIPEITISEGETITVKYGSSVTLTCEVSAYPPPNIIWKNSSEKILSKEISVKVIPYNYVSYLTLNTVKKPDLISCYAENQLSSTKKSINIKVKFFEVNTQLPAIIEVKYGTAKTINCDIESKLPMKTYWYFQKKESSSKVILTTSDIHKISKDGKKLTVANMDRDQNGKYICEATLDGNENEKETLQTELKVVGLEVPVIEKTRGLYNVLINTAAKLVCKLIKGIPKPQVTWQWKPINSRWEDLHHKGEQLYIPKVHVTHAGVYRCIAKNMKGVDQFDSEVVVNFPPEIKTDKTSYELVADVPSKKIPCTAIGYPAPVVTWHLGENQITSGEHYSIQDGSLMIKKPQENESTLLTCTATNIHGSVSKVFKLAVHKAPKLDKSVKLVKAFVNTSTTINCKLLNGTPKPKVTWQWRSKNSTWTTLSHIGDKLQLSPVKLSHAGEYKCVAENKQGVDELETTLIVQSPPIIISNVTEYIGMLGDRYLRIACRFIGYPAPSVKWRKENTFIIPNDVYAIDEGYLLISNPQEMETNFTCEVSNEFGKDSKTFNVSVYYYLKDYGEKKIIFAKNDDKPSEDAKKFTCPLPYKDPASIRWFTNGFSNNITGPVLKIDEYTDGNHTCRVSERHSSNSYTFVLDIGYPPKFTNTETIIDWSGSDEEVNCEVEAKPKAQIEWYFNNKKIDESYKFAVTHPISNGWGNYTCKASNIHGTIEKNTIVKSRDCLIKRFQRSLYPPLILKKISEDDSNLSWPEYLLGSDFFNILSEDTVTFSCAGDADVPNYFNQFPGINEIEAVCDNQDSFVINGSIYKTSDLTCNKEVKPTIVNTGETCDIERIHKLKVGFKAVNFVEAYEVCYDSKRAVIHSVHANTGTWGEIINSAGYNWYHYPGISKRNDSELYNCSDTVSSCCYAKSQLLSADVESYSSGTQLSTYIENVNAVPEWRSCNGNSDTWLTLKAEISKAVRDTDAVAQSFSGASYTSKFGLIPKYLWQLLIGGDEMNFALVYVNNQDPVDEDILCKNSCGNILYQFLELNLTEKSTFCCNMQEFQEKFTPLMPNGYIDLM